jgi:uncharacterized protein (DUF433 family)
MSIFGVQAVAMKPYQQIISVNPSVRSGKPTIRNLRITVADVLGYLSAGMTRQEIVADFPKLTDEDINACLAYAADSEKHVKFTQ